MCQIMYQFKELFYTMACALPNEIYAFAYARGESQFLLMVPLQFHSINTVPEGHLNFQVFQANALGWRR